MIRLTSIGRQRPFLVIGAALLMLYGLTYHGFIGSVIDESMMLGVTAQIADAHTLQINPLYPQLLEWGAPAADPAHPIYSKYGIGQSLLDLPLYMLGKLIPTQLYARTPTDNPFLPLIPLMLSMGLGSFVTLLTVFGVYKTVHLIDYSARTAALIALLYAVTTLAWPYAKRFYNEPSTACALIGLVYFSIRYRRVGWFRDGLAAGACLSAAILLRPTSVLFIPLPLLYMLPMLNKAVVQKWIAACVRAWLPLLIGIGAGVLIMLGYNAYRFGSIFESGYEPGFGRVPWEALIGYVVSPSRSLFLFNPILLLAIPGGWLLSRRLPRETLYVLAISVLPAFVYATWWAWDGGATLGPRFLVPSIPLLMLFAAPLIERPRWRPALIGLGVVGFGVQVLCNLPLTSDFYLELFDKQHVTPNAVNWQFNDSIIANLWTTYTTHRIDSTIFHLLPASHPILTAALVTAISALLCGLMLWAALGETLRVRPPDAILSNDHSEPVTLREDSNHDGLPDRLPDRTS